MQSHHRSFPSQLGHRRRPSIGKSMPVTALLMNLPAPNQMQRYTTYAGDSSTPEAQKPPMVFDLSELEELESRKGETGDYCNNCKENCPSFKREISTPYPALEKLCTLLCNKKCNEPQTGGCNDIIETPSTKPRTPATLDENRRKFLNDILSSCNEDKSKHVSKTTTEDLGGPIDFRQKPGIAEALAKTSMMTSPAAKRRLAARKIELERDHYNNSPTGSDDEKEFIPPRELLLYLVRMGSFNSTPRINNSDTQDDTLEIPQGLTTNDMLHHCKIMRGEDLPKLLDRSFLKSSDNAVTCNDITDGVRVLKLNAFSKICSKPVSSPKHLRILQWNILSQTLGQNNDGFVRCPDEALTWENRKYLIVEEIIKSNPDVICLQEVDHFKFLERVLGTQNYTGIFFPKPDSPCLYIEENNGPDGCAIFYKRDKFDLINYDTRILEVWRVQSNQVAIAANLKIIETGKEICICTTHLKARNGALLSKLRNEQGKDLLKFVNEISEDRPVLICGDFNAEPVEPVYSTVLNNKLLGLCSAYAEINAKEKAQSEKSLNNDATDCCSDNQVGEEVHTLSSAEVSAKHEPPYTTWKIREEGEVCHTIDYVFYSKKALKVTNCLSFPDEGEIGKNRTPSFQYPSDHFSLVCDFEILEGQQS